VTKKGQRPADSRPTDRTAHPSTGWPWLFLLVFATIETLRSLSGLPVLFDDAPDIPGTTPGGLLITASIILSPLLAAVAFIFALRSEIDRAIMALASVTLLRWASYLPSVVIHWPETDLMDFEGILRLVVLPVLAVVAITLARRKERLGLATALVILPTIVDILGVAAFAISVSIYGF
jgi:hypothetical protein